MPASTAAFRATLSDVAERFEFSDGARLRTAETRTRSSVICAAIQPPPGAAVV